MQIHSFLLSVLLILSSITHASSNDSWNGDIIAEPELADYREANRAPGILVEPYDIIESDRAN